MHEETLGMNSQASELWSRPALVSNRDENLHIVEHGEQPTKQKGSGNKCGKLLEQAHFEGFKSLAVGDEFPDGRVIWSDMISWEVISLDLGRRGYHRRRWVLDQLMTRTRESPSGEV
jgi:hypothetical protein